MANIHFHGGLGHGGPNHVCMMESYDPEVVQSTMGFQELVDENNRYAEELETLRALLAKNNISIPAKPSTKPAKKPRRSLRLCNKNGLLGLEGYKPLPDLPMEILLRILGFAVTSPTPIIDPFYKLRKDNVTKAERSSRKSINVSFLATCKAFSAEGIKFIVENNELVFTQAAALENFARIPAALRADIEHVTIRCVGRYYSDKQRKLALDGDTIYHESIDKFIVPTHPRPVGLVQDGGIQAYCWYQVADLLKALQLPLDRATKLRPKLFPNMKSMRMDLVNFCDHLPLGIWGFASVIRWHLGAICDELLITGIPELEGGTDEEHLLRNLLRDEGLISTGCPVFISTSSGLKPLEGHGYSQQVVRANKIFSSKAKSAKFSHPEGGDAPDSTYDPGTTIWKWTTDHSNRPKTWIEFDRVTGFPMNEIDPQMDDSDNDDEDDEDGSGNSWSDEIEDDDEEYDSDDAMFGMFAAHMPAFMSLIGGPPPPPGSDMFTIPSLMLPENVADLFDDMPPLMPNEDDEIPSLIPVIDSHSETDSID